mgnify:CR=1 FL=1
MSRDGKVDLICFPGAPNLPIFAALEFGLFSAAGIDVRLETTPSSIYQIENLVNGEFQIAGTAFDNVVAYREGQGAVQLAQFVHGVNTAMISSVTVNVATLGIVVTGVASEVLFHVVVP